MLTAFGETVLPSMAAKQSMSPSHTRFPPSISTAEVLIEKATKRHTRRARNSQERSAVCGRASCRAGLLPGLGRRFGFEVGPVTANRAGFLGSGHARKVIDVTKWIGSAHVQFDKLAIVQIGDFCRRRRHELADNRMRHSETD